MRKNLIIDIGNSTAKIGIANPDDIHVAARYTERRLSAERISVILDENPEITAAIICSTRRRDTIIEKILAQRLENFISLDYNTPVPIQNLYSTPETLGPDRLAAAVGAAAIEPGKNLLIADFGSAITIDIVTATGEYLGGNISPGMSMRFFALHRMTEKLPLCLPPEKVTLTGRNTTEAIQNGVALGILMETEGYIERAEKLYAGLKIFFTGRDAFYFADKLKKTIFANRELVLCGLNRIIEYNAK